jgi:hypothetical protein
MATMPTPFDDGEELDDERLLDELAVLSVAGGSSWIPTTLAQPVPSHIAAPRSTEPSFAILGSPCARAIAELDGTRYQAPSAAATTTRAC